MKSLKNISTVEEWESEKRNAFPEKELVIFKYSPICSISSSVEVEFDAWYNKLPEDSHLECVKIDVINARPLSRHISEELDVMHQSPQLIWLTKDNKVKWHESHYGISASKLKQLAEESMGN